MGGRLKNLDIYHPILRVDYFIDFYFSSLFSVWFWSSSSWLSTLLVVCVYNAVFMRASLALLLLLLLLLSDRFKRQI